MKVFRYPGNCRHLWEATLKTVVQAASIESESAMKMVQKRKVNLHRCIYPTVIKPLIDEAQVLHERFPTLFAGCTFRLFDSYYVIMCLLSLTVAS